MSNTSMLNCFTETSWLRKLVPTMRAMVRSTSKLKSSKSLQTFASLRPNLCSGQSSWMYSVVSQVVSHAITLLTFVPVIFFKTRAPVEPVSFVQRICEDAAKQNAPKRTRFCNRLTPMTLMGKATEEGLEKTAKEVLASHFHTEPRVPTKVRSLATLYY